MMRWPPFGAIERFWLYGWLLVGGQALAGGIWVWCGDGYQGAGLVLSAVLQGCYLGTRPFPRSGG